MYASKKSCIKVAQFNHSIFYDLRSSKYMGLLRKYIFRSIRWLMKQKFSIHISTNRNQYTFC